MSFLISISLFMIILVVFASLLIFTCVASEEFGTCATAQLMHALITSCLDFCNRSLYNLPNKQIERLQWIQNQAARMLKRIPRRNHITPILRELYWLRIHDRIIFKILLLTHKAVNNTAPDYLCDLIRLNVKSTTIRTCASFDPSLLCVPPISKMWIRTYLTNLHYISGYIYVKHVRIQINFENQSSPLISC